MVRRFTRSGHAIMATGTATGCTGMVKCCGYPGQGRMTVITWTGGLNVRARLSAGRCPIVTVCACSSHTGVVHDSRNPAVGRVTVVAGVGTLDMGTRLAGRRCTIVAGGTGGRG
jgi:hypothetical protein